MQLANLLVGRNGLKKVRYEGVEDVDLLYEGGLEQYIQLKNEPRTRYTIAALRPVLQAFAVDLLEAGEKSNVQVVLVARSHDRNEAVDRLIARAGTNSDREEIARHLVLSTGTVKAPDKLLGLKPEKLAVLVEQLVSKIEMQFGRGDESDGETLFELQARSRMEERGIFDVKIQRQAVAALRGALQPRAEFSAEDVERLVSRFVQTTALERFAGTVELLTDEQGNSPVNAHRVQQYYEGHPASWEIVAASADVERTQLASILERILEPCDSARIVCLVGDPGSGKSTMLLRSAWEAHRRMQVPVLRARISGSELIWTQLRAFYKEVRRSFVLVVDDAFRDARVFDGLDSVGLDVPVTIVTAAWPGELRRAQIRQPIDEIRLKGVDVDERVRALRLFNKQMSDLTDEQRRHFEASSSFLVLMTVLSTGKGLREHYDGILRWLREKDSAVYAVYEYVCFVFQFGVSCPAIVLERLDKAGRFYRIVNREAASSVLFEEDGSNQIRAAHILVAREVSAIYGRSPLNLLDEIASTIDPQDERHRRFWAHLMRAFAQQSQEVVTFSVATVSKVSASICAAPIPELPIWHAFYRAQGLDDEAQRVAELAVNRQPKIASEWANVLGMLRGDDVKGKLLPVMRQWVEDHPEERATFRLYLRLVAEHSVGVLLEPLETFVRTLTLDAEGDLVLVLRLLNRYLSWGRKKRRFLDAGGERLMAVEKIMVAMLGRMDGSLVSSDVARSLLGVVPMLTSLDLRQRALVLILGCRSCGESVVHQAVRTLTVFLGVDVLRRIYVERFEGAELEFKVSFARALRATRHLGLAVEIYEALLEENPNSVLVFFCYGELLIKLRNYGRALELLGVVFEGQPDRRNLRLRLAQANEGLGLLARRAKKEAEAKVYYARARAYLDAAYSRAQQGSRHQMRAQDRMKSMRRKSSL
ncbi:hypothetical protein [Corallococcus sp. AS-1-6]|uniref:P-loop NTPase n=1 Tax=Corallococcus sp. AS-1-6 TaxID=2874599 RepID=UPI001CBB5F99|nr:hypothetical protein [Corallococcus sp. AS-1-6]MBZ4376485.1 hypothetical protein [Corallococcus sp. AS-1-6]